MRVQYEKSDTYQFIGAEIPTGLCDLVSMPRLRVWVAGSVKLLLKAEDRDGRQMDVGQATSADPTAFSLLEFDLRSVANQLDLTRIKNLFFFPAPGDASASGIFFIDDVGVSRP